MAPQVRRLGVFYPFCGVDLGHALALFPDAPRHVMLAALPLGDPLCFVIAQCREHMTKMMGNFLRHWAWQGFGWTQTFRMNQYLYRWTCCDNSTAFRLGSPPLSIGVIAPLVLSLAMAGHKIEHLYMDDGATHLQLRTDRTRVNYFSRTISPEPSVCARRHPIASPKPPPPYSRIELNSRGSRPPLAYSFRLCSYTRSR